MKPSGKFSGTTIRMPVRWNSICNAKRMNPTSADAIRTSSRVWRVLPQIATGPITGIRTEPITMFLNQLVETVRHTRTGSSPRFPSRRAPWRLLIQMKSTATALWLHGAISGWNCGIRNPPTCRFSMDMFPGCRGRFSRFCPITVISGSRSRRILRRMTISIEP